VTVRVGNGRDERQWFKPGNGKSESFQDCIDGVCDSKGPEMVVVPGGEFMMGSPQNEAASDRVLDVPEKDERPQHKVSIGKPFAVGKYAVTFAEWDACVADGGCNGYKPSDNSWGRGDRPVINVGWNDAQAYVKWLSGKTGMRYRLPSEAEREYVTRAGTTTHYWWGDTIPKEQVANYSFSGKTEPVNSYRPNPWGLYQVHGNVWEWVEDRWHADYNGAPSDGSAWTKGGDESRRVLRGGSWAGIWQYRRFGVRAASRHDWSNVDRYNDGYPFGFRVCRTLNP
jgi:formylglycine-generating enzyme required for sulfatase activity